MPSTVGNHPSQYHKQKSILGDFLLFILVDRRELQLMADYPSNKRKSSHRGPQQHVFYKIDPELGRRISVFPMVLKGPYYPKYHVLWN